jgi:hypothetical protein
MSLTKEQRAEINRQNARKSTGPKSEEGKERSRQNAMRHGLRAEVLATPDEDPAAVAERVKEWEDYYQPDSPATKHLVAQCAQASLLSERCQRYHDAMVELQFRDAKMEWAQALTDEIEGYKEIFEEAPAVAVRRLQETAAGARYLAERWEHLRHAFAARGHWTAGEEEEAIRLLGHRPEELQKSEEAFKVALCNYICMPQRAPEDHERIAANVPLELRGRFGEEPLPDADTTAGHLIALATAHAKRLRALEPKLFEQVDLRRLHEAQARALLIKDNKQAHLYLRYMSEARNLFQRSLSALMKLKKQGEPVFEGSTEAPSAAEAVAAPNEANAAANDTREKTSDGTVAADPAPERPREASPEHQDVVMSLPVPSPAVSESLSGPVLARKSA